MKHKLSVLQIVRSAIQIICFFLLPGLFIDCFYGFKAIISAISEGSDVISVLPQLYPAALLILATLLFGRFFCGYMCAFGTLSDLFSLFGRKVIKLKVQIPEKTDRILKWTKYILLAFLVIIWISGIEIFSGWSPWNAFGVLNAFPPDFAYAFANFAAGSILLLILMIGSAFVERFFCRYFCPMGAIFSAISKIRITRISKKKALCGKCRICTGDCAMGIPMYESDEINSGECIECMRCVPRCPRKNVKFTVAAKDAAPLAVSVAAAATIGLYHVGNIGVNTLISSVSAIAEQTGGTSIAKESTSPDVSANASLSGDPAQPSSGAEQSTEPSSQTEQVSQNLSSGYIDGTYQGSGTGFKGNTVTVCVTIKDGKITDIETVSSGSSGRDKQYYDSAFSGVSSEIISKQSTAVDAVSGATYSSVGIMSAVADALSRAIS